MKKKYKSPSESEIIMHQLVMPGDTNAHNTIFGGTIMSWMDIAAAMCAQKHCNNPVVTVHISDIDFINPIKMGNQVVIKASMNYAGKTSMVIGVRVESENPYDGITQICTKAYLTFVAIDKENRPIEVPNLIPETADEKRRYENAKIRRELKKKLNKELKE